jgi:hypothetical protein
MTAQGIGRRRDYRLADAALGAGNWLRLAAAPTFAIMALLTGVLGGGPQDLLCSAAHADSPLSGMIPMYALMTAFHAGPWLKLIAGRRSMVARGEGGLAA